MAMGRAKKYRQPYTMVSVPLSEDAYEQLMAVSYEVNESLRDVIVAAALSSYGIEDTPDSEWNNILSGKAFI